MTEFSRRLILGGALTTAATPALSAPTPVAVKVSEFYRRPDGVSIEAHLERWRRTRGAAIRALPGVTRAALNIVNAERSPNAPFDGVVQTWFRDMSAFQATMAGAEAQDALTVLAEDTPGFMQFGALNLVTTEAVIRPLPSLAEPGMGKRIGLVGRTPSVDRERFIVEWRDHHAPEVLPQHGLIGYSLNIAEAPRTPGSPWDGYAELWWSDWAAFDEASRQGSAGYARRSSFFYSHQVAYVTEYA